MVNRAVKIRWWKNLYDGSFHKRKVGFPTRMVNFLWVEIVPAAEVPECFH